MALWKVFGVQQEATVCVLQVLTGILEKLHGKEETTEMNWQPVLVSAAEGRDWRVGVRVGRSREERVIPGLTKAARPVSLSPPRTSRNWMRQNRLGSTLWCGPGHGCSKRISSLYLLVLGLVFISQGLACGMEAARGPGLVVWNQGRQIIFC